MSRRIMLIGLVCGLIPALLAFAFIAWSTGRELRETAGMRARQAAEVRAQAVTQEVRKMKQLLLATAVNPVFREYFQAPPGSEAREKLKKEADKALQSLNRSFRNMVGESCFIQQGGQELARVVFEDIAPAEDLSPEEADAPFYKPAMEAAERQVIVNGPYLSPDVAVPVLAFATPVVVDGAKTALVHMEVPIAYFAQQLSLISGDHGLKAYLLDERGKVLVEAGRPVSEKGEFPAFRMPEGGWLTTRVPLNPDSGVSWQVVTAMPAPGTADLVRRLQGGIVVSLLGIGVCLVAGWALGRRMARPAVRLMEASERLAAGDLTVEEIPVQSRDELGRLVRSFNRMVGQLRDMIGRIERTSSRVSECSVRLAATADQTARATQQISTAIQVVAKGAAEQTHSAEETARIMDQLRQAIEQIAQGAQNQAGSVVETTETVGGMAQAIDQVHRTAREVSDAAARALAAAEDGGAAVEQAVAGMARIRDTALEAATRVKELGEKSQRIGEIVQVIGGIADQTNLLALNAAIEAARAGEQGKGFAVVAEEVRKLAERSARATKDISDLIGTIQAGLEAAVAAMDAGTREVEAGTALAASARRGLEGILEGMREADARVRTISAAAAEVAAKAGKVVKMVDDVAAVAEENTAATEEMAASSDHVSRAVRSVAAVSEETAASAEEVSASTDEVNRSAEEIRGTAQGLVEMARELQAVVSRFKL